MRLAPCNHQQLQANPLQQRVNQSFLRFLSGDEYTIADIATYPWYGTLVIGEQYDAQEFLDVQGYTHVARWANEIHSRPAVIRGSRVNTAWGPAEEQLHERHSAADFTTCPK